MADTNWWETDTPHKNDVTTGSVETPKQDWWKEDIGQETNKAKTKIPRDKSIMERAPFIGDYVTRAKNAESDWVDKLEKDNPGFRAAYYGQKKIEGVANDIAGSFGTAAITGPGTLLNMGTQGAYGAASRAKDLIAEKGSNLGASDAWDITKSGLYSSLGPLFGRILSPTSKSSVLPKAASGEVETAGKPTFESIKAGLRGENGSPELNEFLQKRWAAQQAKKIEDTTHAIGRGIEWYKDSPMSAITRATNTGLLPYIMGAGPVYSGLAAAGGAVLPHVPKIGSMYWHNQMNPAILQSLITSGAINTNTTSPQDNQP